MATRYLFYFAAHTCCVLLLSSQCLQAQPELIINEILYAPTSAQTEFIEVLNTSDQPLDLCTFMLSDSRDIPEPLCGGRLFLQPDAFTTLTKDSLLLTQAFPHVSGLIVSPVKWPALNNSGDTVKLSTANKVIDEVAYLSSWGTSGKSIERKDPAGPSGSQFNWGISTDLNYATPGIQNSVYAPDRQPPALFLAEVSTSQQITLLWQEPIRTELLNTSNFDLAGQPPAQVEPLSATEIILHFDAPINERLITFSGIQDLTGNKSDAQLHPLAYLPGPGDIVINEIMYAPRADPFDHLPNQPEYVELFNKSDYLLSLRQIAMVGQLNDQGSADVIHSSAPYPTVKPQAFTLYHAMPSQALPDNTLVLAFPDTDFSSEAISLLPVTRSSLGLLNAGDFIAIQNRSATILDQVTYSPNWHHPLLEETRGIALERRNVNISTHLPNNWSSSVHKAGGTPGILNSIANSNTDPINHPQNYTQHVSLSTQTLSPNGDGLDDVLEIRLEVGNPTSIINVKVFDLYGRQVRHVARSVFAGSKPVFFWEGYDEHGQILPVGVYIVLVEMLDVSAGIHRMLKLPVVLALPLG